MLATSFVSGVNRPAAVSSRKSTFAGSTPALSQSLITSTRVPQSHVVQVEGMLRRLEGTPGHCSCSASPTSRSRDVSDSCRTIYAINEFPDILQCFTLSRRHLWLMDVLVDSSWWETFVNGGMIVSKT